MDGLVPTERYAHSCVIHENMVYIWGGQKDGRYFNDLFLFNISIAPKWTQLHCDISPEPRSGHIAAIYEGKMYIFGGTNGSCLFNDLWSFDLQTLNWSKIDAEGIAPVARESCASAMVDDVIYILGGKGDHGTELNDICAFKIKSRRWFSFHNMGPAPSPRHGLTMSVIRDRLFVFGGDNDSCKMDDSSLMYILDSTKIKYPIEIPQPTLAPSQPEDTLDISPQPSQSYRPQQPKFPVERVLQPSPRLKATVEPNNSFNDLPQQPSPTPSSSTGSRTRSLYPDSQPPARPPRHMSSVPEAALRRPRAGSSPHPPPPDLLEDSRIVTEEDVASLPPPRPPREVTRMTEEDKLKRFDDEDKERQMLMREIKARDTVISEMKKKESWWRAEVSLARKLRKNEENNDTDADERLLMDVDHLSDDRVKLFEQLVSVKSELRRVRAHILQQASPMSDKVQQADRMRTAALQEAAYFKSKYLALKARRHEELGILNISRSDELEKRLALALTENEVNSKTLQQLQKRSLHDQGARLATEERAREAQERAEEAQEAHQRALEELQAVYTRATKAESQVRENAIKVADLTNQLSEALTSQPIIKSQEVSDAQFKASQLEAANLKARNESATLKQKLAENMDDILRLNTALNEREDALSEARLHIEDYEIQLNMLRDAMNQKSSVNGFAPTPAY